MAVPEEREYPPLPVVLHEMERRLAELIKTETERTMLNLDRLIADVAAQTTAVNSAIKAFETIVAELRATDGDQAKVDALADILEAGTAKLASAIPANTTPVASDSEPPPAAPGAPTPVAPSPAAVDQTASGAAEPPPALAAAPDPATVAPAEATSGTTTIATSSPVTIAGAPS